VATTDRPKRPANLNSMGIHRTLALLYAGLGVVFFFVLSQGQPIAGPVIAVPAILLGFTAFHVAIAYGASRKAGWARVLSILVGIFLLFAFPIGTIVGGYLLYNSKWSEGVNA
jgi:hypothetical protein